MSGTTATVNNTRFYYESSGSGDAVLMLHGWPQTSYCWRGVVPRLEDSYRVITPDLRGLGRTSDPHTGYDKRSIAADLAMLMTDAIGVDRFHVVGHDWGGVVAFSLAAHHRELVRSLTVVDVTIPSPHVPSMAQGGKRWHHAFHHTPSLPEELVTGREEIYLNWFYDHFGAQPAAIGQADRKEYARWYREPNVLHAGFEYYRAVEQDRLDASRVDPLRLPVLAVGGGSSWGRGQEVKESLQPLVHGPIDEVIIDSAGHWVPEEEPELLAAAIRRHIAGSA